MIGNSTDFSEYFNTLVVDNNGIAGSDINLGLMTLFGTVNESNISEVERYLVAEFEAGYPELVAYNSAFGSAAYWWWLLILNYIDDPLTGIKENWVYSINTPNQIENVVNTINVSASKINNDRKGDIVELN